MTSDDGRETEVLVEVRGLQVEYGKAQPVRAVDGVDLKIRAGEIVGLAGESGCGKSTVANAVMQILRPPGRVVGGSVLFRGEELTGKSDEELRKFRWRNVSMVFQSAMNGLNPVMRVGAQFVDMMQAHERISKRDAIARAGELLELVGIDPRRVRSYPHQLSGGMRQRVIIAMALALEPELVIMDEPTTALDVVVQREILQQIQDLQRERGFAVLFITHDLSLLIEVADRIAIMYAGEIVETAPAATLHAAARHPYTHRAAPVVPAAPRATRADDRHPGLAARPDRPAERLPLPPSLPAVRAGRTAPTRPRCTSARSPSAPCCASSSPPTSSRATGSSVRALHEPVGAEPNVELEVRGLTKYFSTGNAPVLAGARARRRRRQLHAPAGPRHRARRRERQRQEHRRAPAPAPLRAHLRERDLRRARHRLREEPARASCATARRCR